MSPNCRTVHHTTRILVAPQKTGYLCLPSQSHPTYDFGAQPKLADAKSQCTERRRFHYVTRVHPADFDYEESRLRHQPDHRLTPPLSF